MSRRKKISGVCQICGKKGKLSFEHVPPRSAFNKEYYAEVNSNYLDEITEDFFEGLDFKNKNVKKKQGGVGYYSLCEKCNNDTGSFYGHSFVNWAHQAMTILLKANGKPTLTYPTFFFPLRVIKQIITMFFSVDDKLRVNEPELVRFILNKETRFLPKRYRVFCYYNITNLYRYKDYSIIGEMDRREFIHLCEISFPPLGFVLTFNSKAPDNRLTEITHFGEYRYNEWVDYYQRFNTLPTWLPFAPGDYRSKKEIITAIKEGSKFKV